MFNTVEKNNHRGSSSSGNGHASKVKKKQSRRQDESSQYLNQEIANINADDPKRKKKRSKPKVQATRNETHLDVIFLDVIYLDVIYQSGNNGKSSMMS